MMGTRAWDELPLRPEVFRAPYDSMIHDLRVAIKGTAGYMAALCLLVYTEVLGRRILTLRYPSNKPERDESFYCFYTEYMGQSRTAADKVYEQFRHGAAHSYYFLAADTSLVGIKNDPDWIPSDGSTTTLVYTRGQREVPSTGALALDGGRLKLFAVNIYFRDFQRGLVKAAQKYPDVFLVNDARSSTGGRGD